MPLAVEAVVERNYVPHGLRVTETFLRYRDGFVAAVTYDYSPEKPLVAVRLGMFADGPLRSLSRRGRSGGSVERYTYEGSCVVRIESRLSPSVRARWS